MCRQPRNTTSTILQQGRQAETDRSEAVIVTEINSCSVSSHQQHPTRQMTEMQAQRLLDLRDGVLDLVGMENATDRSVAQFIAREHDPARTVSVDLFDDLGQRRALENQQATPPSSEEHTTDLKSLMS